MKRARTKRPCVRSNSSKVLIGQKNCLKKQKIIAKINFVVFLLLLGAHGTR